LRRNKLAGGGNETSGGDPNRIIVTVCIPGSLFDASGVLAMITLTISFYGGIPSSADHLQVL
jgi:hypothetical protein